jgi:LysM repeat protein
MKEPSPLVPQGSFEAQARSKSRVKLAFYTIVAIHVLAIGGFLIIGCKRDDKEAVIDPPPPTNDLATVPPIGSDPAVTAPGFTNTNPPVGFTPPPAPANVGVPSGTPTNLVPPPQPVVPTNPNVATPEPLSPPPVQTAMTEHTIVRGDTFDTIARKYGVAVKDVVAANPNLNPTRLKIGDKVKIPPKSATTAANGNRNATTSDPGTYKVKSGDTLSKIAAAHKTTVKELQRLNNLGTTQIKVGQVLKVPSSSNPSAATSGGTAVPGTTPPPPAQ